MSSIKCRHWGWVVALAAAALVAGVAAPAQAKDEFEDAFKYELGRIAAHQTVYAGTHILGTVLGGGHRHHRGCGHGYAYGDPGHHQDYGHYGHGYYRRHYRNHYRNHGHHRGWRYRHGSHHGDRHGYYSHGRRVHHRGHHGGDRH